MQIDFPMFFANLHVRPMTHPVLRTSLLERAARWSALAALLIGLLALGHPLAALAQPNAAPASAVAPVPALPAAVNAPMPPPNAYGLGTVWAQGDGIARTTLVLLVLMSLLSWYVIIAKLIEQRRLTQQAQAARTAFARAASVQQGAAALDKGSVFQFLVETAVDAQRKHESLAGQVDIGTWLTQDIMRSVATLQMRMHAGMSVLATVGSTAPFVGLFGTVWGIYHALVTIGSTGQASIEKVAGPVGEALIMTALGLAVAVPAVLGYNWLVRRNRLAMHGIKGFGSDLHTLLLVEVERNQRNAAAPSSQG